MNNFLIITNNPAVVKKFPSMSEFHDKNVEGVFLMVRDMVHAGAKVLSHPLSGSVKPWESPYKSVCVTKHKGALDYDSLATIENALVTMKNRKYGHVYSEKVLEDFRVIDLDLISSAIE